MALQTTQRGFALVAALIFMVVLSIVAVGLSGTTTSEERMARNFRDQDTAFAAAEAALRDGELFVEGSWHYPYAPPPLEWFHAECDGGTGAIDSDGDGNDDNNLTISLKGLCDFPVGYTGLPVHKLDFFATSDIGSRSVMLGSVTQTPALPGLTSQPRYMIELVTNIKGPQDANGNSSRAFRITAMARGRLSTTSVVLQEVYVVTKHANL
ncbi:MAG: hypothetical protein KA603_05595 [Azonexus sp.]|nr:hypothetical protein [Betaproteobacteria bacterium]MBK8917197.1 hypothetical protein [Betaproteobacteria bacterium]MBP6035593.1 hypothetical protein [Azonexus sp.]MBP6906173.1 hypothetical protein [Azonexus sp.]